MGFGGLQPGPEGAVGAELLTSERVRTAAGSESEDFDVPANRTRLRLYGLWISMSANALAAAADPVRLRITAEVKDQSFSIGQFAVVNMYVAAPAATWSSNEKGPAEVFRVDRGLVLPAGEGLAVRLLVSNMVPGVAPANFEARAVFTLLLRGES